MFNPTVQLKSGGYIVIDVTEALVAIDVNSGRATREASIEETALKTNMEAAEEAARQMRLRDLAGLIVIDFIDMEDRRNNAAVEKKLKDKLKTDRARIQVGRISAFGLLEMSRQRLRPGMIEATTKACPHCHGTGRVRSDDSMALALLREIEEEGVKQRSKEVLIVAPVEIANYLLNQKREHIAMIEVRFGLSVRVEGDRVAGQPGLPGGAVQDRLADHPGAGEPEPADGRLPRGGDRGGGGRAPEEEEEAVAEAGQGERPAGKRKRRRRRRGGKGERENGQHAEPRRRGGGGGAGSRRPSRGGSGRSGRRGGAGGRAGGGRGHSRSRGGARGAASAARRSPAKRRRRVPAPVAAEIIDLGEEPVSEIVEVPEADAPQPRRRERVRKPVTAVLAEVIVGRGGGDHAGAARAGGGRGGGAGGARGAPGSRGGGGGSRGCPGTRGGGGRGRSGPRKARSGAAGGRGRSSS